MNDSRVRITLIGVHLAEPGAEFIYEGPTEACEGCKVYKVCNNLRKGRRYRIVSVRGTAVQTCSVHRDGACAVEVIEAPAVTLINAESAFVNSKITFEPNCTNTECPSYLLCHPEGIIEGEHYLVGKVLGNPVDSCEMERRLKLVELRPD